MGVLGSFSCDVSQRFDQGGQSDALIVVKTPGRLGGRERLAFVGQTGNASSKRGSVPHMGENQFVITALKPRFQWR